MSTQQISRDIALRIGLAAKTLPGMEPGTLISILGKAIGHPVTPEKLEKLGYKAFRQAGGEKLLSLPAHQLKTALGLLKGEGIPGGDNGPAPQPYTAGDMPDSIRVACASNNQEMLDGHFGSCSRFLIYQISSGDIRLVDVRPAAQPADNHDEKNKWRADLIADCQVLMVVSIGGPAAAKVVRADVHPIKHPQGGQARDILAELQKVLAGAPPPWLARIMGLEPKTLAPFRQGAEA